MKNISIGILFSFAATALPVLATAQEFVVDDLVSVSDSRWSFISDQVMGGVSSGGFEVKTHDGELYIEMTGRVSTENNGGFIQVRREIEDDSSSRITGVTITVKGNGQPYFLHLRTRWTLLPWQYYQARFETSELWQEIQLPFSAFKPSSRILPSTVNRSALKSLGLVAFGRDHDAMVSIKEIGFY